MKLTIDQTILDKYGLSVEEFLVLYLMANNVNIDSCMENLITKGFANRNLYKHSLVISDNIKDIISTIVIDSDKNVIDKDDEFLELAKEMQELYPSGRKPGTNYMWRGTVAEVAKRLKTLVVKYKYSYTKEQVIKATKEYISSFNGDYRTMRLLKYFILKSEKDYDNNINVISDLMTLIENEGQIEEQRNDWISTMI